MSESEEYSLIILGKVNPEAPLPSDIYLHVDKKYIKFRSKGDMITQQKFDLFISKGVKNLYVKNEDIMMFLEWISETAEEEIEGLVAEGGEENRGVFERSAGMKEKVYDVFIEEELSTETVGVIQEQVASFVEGIQDDPLAAKAIRALMEKNASIADHSVNVANLAVYLGMALGHGHQFVLENIYMGSIFHDYGKAKIPAHLLENSGDRLYSQAINDHPLTGCKVIEKSSGVPKQVFSIIRQHHEQWNGGGYPQGLKADEIYDLAQVVALANTFDNLLQEHKRLPQAEKFKRAIKYIEMQNGKMFSPKLYPRVLDALKLAFGNFKRDTVVS
ncbi:MAG: HD domain-containing protein [Halobacteriovoraceae bacterium]|nr:HD domain-containing protein [Halobacteriovoraceae bacterium]MBT5093046.1 HD domain-containing protein [Halobacteriovoraceae bacterium]